MRPVLQFATSVTMLAGLLFQAISHAAPTNMAEQPLKASVLAKPNVIFGLDDSGSMDSEVMLYNNDGAYWWNYSARTGWGVDAAHPNVSLRTLTTTHFNAAGDASSTWRKMVYLFPNGTGTGRRVYGDASNDHFPVMPTSQFAFLRWSGVYKSGSTYSSPPTDPALSPVHNPIYYNPLVTYKPWAPAYISNAVTPAAATLSAVKSHPMNGVSGTNYSGGSGTFDLTASAGVALDTADNRHFIALPGMTIPAGAQKSVCDSARANCGSWTNVTADEAATTTGVTRVAMAYFPATYWVQESCTVNGSASVGARDCATAPDGTTTLKRYEIKSGNTFPSGRSYADELQNFANWMQYYRKRKLMLAGAMGETLETLNGMRLGVVKFNNHASATLYDADATSSSSNRLRVAGIFYDTNGDGGTPTRETLKYIGDQFKRTDMTSGKYNVMQYSCQRNNAFIVTDGFANASSVTLPGWDSGRSATSFSSGGAPYETSYTNSLAEIALRYYINNVRLDLTPGAVPTTTRDINPDPHMNTYGLTMGARGTLFLNESVANPTSISAWPNPSANRSPTSVDDLWHATINGRGKMYLATTPEETALRIRAGLEDIKSEEGAQSSVAVSTFNLLASDGKAYEASYNPAGWVGDLTASGINMTTGAISNTPTWSASALLAARPWTDRKIFTSTAAGGGIPFTDANIGSTVNPDIAAFPVSEDVVNYLRGKRTGEGSTFRTRTGLIGAVINAEPTIDSSIGVVYVASSEGMLHAFDTSNGSELWAFVPYPTLATIGKTVQREYAFKTKLDGTPTIGKYTDGGGKLLVAGMGAAGRGYYALDVSNPKGMSSETAAAGQVKWRFPSTATADKQPNVGYTVGRPVIVKTISHGYVVLVTSGYDNGETIGDGKGRLWMLNANTGAVINEFTTTAGAPGSEAGLSQIIAYGENTGTARYVYGGDLLGNLWKFDLEDLTTSLVTTLLDAANNRQPVTTAPQLTRINGKPVIMVATGRLLDITDFGSSSVQSVYAVVDNGSNTQVPRSNMDALTHNTTTRVITGTVDWVGKRGWYVDLPAGEQVNVDPKFALGWLYVNANSAGGSNCAQGASGYKIYVRSGSGVSDSLSSTSLATSPVLVQVNQKTMNRWTRLGNGGIDNDQYNVGKTHVPRSNAWRDSR
jgi:type IV pilus assembly protein PilY1